AALRVEASAPRRPRPRPPAAAIRAAGSTARRRCVDGRTAVRLQPSPRSTHTARTHRMTPQHAHRHPSILLPAVLRHVTIAGVFASASALLVPGGASAQSLRELYDAARSYDATYLSARALADSAQHKAAQADALKRP